MNRPRALQSDHDAVFRECFAASRAETIARTLRMPLERVKSLLGSLRAMDLVAQTKDDRWFAPITRAETELCEKLNADYFDRLADEWLAEEAEG